MTTRCNVGALSQSLPKAGLLGYKVALDGIVLLSGHMAKVHCCRKLSQCHQQKRT